MKGESTLLRANFVGNPTPVIKWYRGVSTKRFPRHFLTHYLTFETRQGKEIVTDGNRVFVDTFNGVSTLSIESVTSDDSGKYLITVENCVGGHSAFASLAVEGTTLKKLFFIVESFL